jgi:hypothetical protein
VCADSQPDGALWFVGDIEGVSMPTAIALTYTLGGFAITADGLERTYGIITGYETKKIFPIRGLDFQLAYALCGRVTFGVKDKDNNPMDLLKKAPYGIIAISGSSHPDLSAYVRNFSMYLYAIVKDAQETQGFQPLSTYEAERFGDNYAVFSIFVAGYYRGQPGCYRATVCHNNQRLLEPTIVEHPLQKDPIIYGSAEIARRIFKTDDPKLSSYRVMGFRDSKQPTLSDGIEAMKNYVRACCDPEIARLDPEICATIGGRIHSAIVTPNDGFSWVCAPAETA